MVLSIPSDHVVLDYAYLRGFLVICRAHVHVPDFLCHSFREYPYPIF